MISLLEVAERTQKGPKMEEKEGNLSLFRKLNALVKKEAMKRGLLIYPMGGAADGVRGDHVLLAPPFILSDANVDAIVERLGEAIDAATAS